MFIYTVRSIVPIAALLAIFVVAACGRDSTAAQGDQTSTARTASNIEAAAAPSATFVVVEVTAAPVPTETPVPVAMTHPTAEPTVELTEERAAEIIAETESQPIVEFPSEITPGAERLESNKVLDHWQQYVNGTRIRALSIIWEFCSDGTGIWIYEVGTPAFTGAKFDYELKSDTGASWHSIIVSISLHDQNLRDLMNYAGGDSFRVALTPPGEDQIAYKSPYCD